MPKRPRHSALVGLLALTSGSPLASAQAQTIWEPLTLPKSEQLRWQRLPDSAAPNLQTPSSIVWTPVKEGEETWLAAPDSSQRKPQTQAEAERLLDSIEPTESDYWPLLRLGPAVPTANQVDELQGAQLSFYQLAPMAGGGDAGGTGNQNYVGRIDLGINDQLQLSGFYSEADDPLFSPVWINGQLANPSNFWQSYGGAAQVELVSAKAWKLAVGGSGRLERR